MMGALWGMNAAYLHLVCTHLPVAGTVFGLGLLVWALRHHQEAMKRTGLGMFVLAALLAAPAYFSGEPAASLVKGLPGVRPELVEQHAEVAGLALIGVSVTGVAALAALVLLRRKLTPAWLSACMLLLALAAAGLLGWTAHLGAKIRHTEIRYQGP